MKDKQVARVNPQNWEAVPKHYSVPVYSGAMDLKRISCNVADKSSLALGNIYNALINFVEDLPEYMRNGFKVLLGDFGFFKASFSNEGVNDPKKFKASMIRSKRVLYHAGKGVKNGWSDLRLGMNDGRIDINNCFQQVVASKILGRDNQGKPIFPPKGI